jgi:hypothetical protein
MKSKPKTETRNVAIIALDPLAEFCNANVGSKIDLANRMTDALGYKIHRQIAEGWVHPDPDKRVEPKLGQGIVLLLVGAEMMKGSKRLNLGPIVKKGLNGHAGAKSKAR